MSKGFHKAMGMNMIRVWGGGIAGNIVFLKPLKRVVHVVYIQKQGIFLTNVLSKITLCCRTVNFLRFM